MRIDVLSVMPQYLKSPLENGIVRIAKEKGLLEVVVHNLHDYGLGKYRQVDDAPFGGGAGMVLKPEPIFACVEKLKRERDYDEVIFLTPDGEKFAQPLANELSLKKNLMLLCGHYKGVDERVRETLVTKEVSIGDYVLSGGELPALVLIDAVARLIPGAINDSESALLDSFQTGLLDCAHYTRPAEFRGMKVPDILLSGHHAKIREWQLQNAIERTQKRRPDLLKAWEAANHAKERQTSNAKTAT
ncbi:MAG: tRNA (guanosine(37)-N1)-methyltransferase TrmD [Chloroherpetonaceae bacterium]|nr:tRNA (guanosine(37)-N1)-methyltransferase TrmD [Chloroherpetonaceae bacterium]MDW8437846.1 tRNA (guanosine(37)-N1)-methyltransferase TrmD [Chloroherpetonaceae bacterium]